MTNMERLRLGVNIDHVATLRNARGGDHPDPLRAARVAQAAGADSITVHLREDRRHIRDADVLRLKSEIDLPMNLEMAATREMLNFALQVRPFAVCIVPERREERTTEGGLDAAGQAAVLAPMIAEMKASGIRVSLFIEADERQLNAARAVDAACVELHTGSYCEAAGLERAEFLTAIQSAAQQATRLGLECHAGHGLNYENVGPIAAIPHIVELNIGHYLVGEALFIGLEASLRKMRAMMDAARTVAA